MIQVIIILILLYIIFIYIKKQDTEVDMVRSRIDGKEYLVQNKKDKQQAADTLAQIKAKLTKFLGYLAAKKDEHKQIPVLLKRVNLDAISEGTEDASYTTYTLNKGEKNCFFVCVLVITWIMSII